MKLIDKAALVAEIEACYNECLKRAKIIDAEYWNGKADAYRYMLVVLDTLEVIEVNLNSEIKNWLDHGDITNTRYDDYDDGDIERTAKHFFELGMSVSNKAQKGE